MITDNIYELSLARGRKARQGVMADPEQGVFKMPPVDELEIWVDHLRDASLLAANIVRRIQLSKAVWPDGRMPDMHSTEQIANAHHRQLQKQLARAESLLRVARLAEDES